MSVAGGAHAGSENADASTEGNYLPSHGVHPKSDNSYCTNHIPTVGLLPCVNCEKTSLLNTRQSVSRRTHENYNSTQAILPASGQFSGDATTPCVSINSDVSVPNVEVILDRRSLTLVTLMVMLVVCSSCLNVLIMDQYLYQHYAQIVFGNTSVDTSSQPCANTSGSVESTNSQTNMIQEVQEQATGMSLYLATTTYCLGILSNMLLGSFSCIMSRKLLLLIPTTGFLIKCALVPVIVNWELDISWFYLGYGIDGICGNTCGILLGTFLYTSDVTPRDQKRTLGITIVETVKSAVGSAFYVVTGQLIETTGYIIPSCIAAGIQCITLLVICILPDRKPVLSEKQLQEIKSVKGALLHMFAPFHAPKTRRVKYMIGLAIAAFFLTITARQGIDKVQNLYVMNLPFCFDAITIGWFLFARDLIQSLLMLLAVIFLFWRWPGMVLGMAGAVSMVAYCLLYSFAHYSWEVLYLGPLFATLAVIESIGFAAGAPIFLSIYKATLGYFTGFVFLIGAGIMLVTFVIMCIYHRLWVVHVRSIQYHKLTVLPPPPDE